MTRLTMHNGFMRAALEQAWLGKGVCAPNPSVGAVAVYEGQIVARAWHKGAGTAHAEQLVLEQIPQDLHPLSLYVTLEPCNHWGKTPPCVSSIIAHRVSKVIYGFSDPNPLVAANNTPSILKSAGVEVLHFPMPEVDAFYTSYQYWMRTKRPWVTVKLAQSFDGKIAGAKGARCALSNVDCASFTHQQRMHADIILTTAQTIVNDDPLFNVRLDGKEIKKPLAILDRRLTLDDKAAVFKTTTHCQVYHDKMQPVADLNPHCSYHAVSVKNERLDLEEVFLSLGRLGFHDVWVEAGGVLFSALHQEKWAQRTYVYVVPDVLGEEATPAFHGKNLFSSPKAVSWIIKGDNAIACLDWQESSCLQD